MSPTKPVGVMEVDTGSGSGCGRISQLTLQKGVFVQRKFVELPCTSYGASHKCLSQGTAATVWRAIDRCGDASITSHDMKGDRLAVT